MVSDRIERDIVVEAPIDRVWATLTQAEHIAGCFACTSAEIDLRPGGALVMRWKEHGTVHARVETVDPPRRFAFRWALTPGEQPRDGNSTLVDFTLSEEGGATHLRVIESGFAGLDGPEEVKERRFAENQEGWSGTLDAVRNYVAQPAA